MESHVEYLKANQRQYEGGYQVNEADGTYHYYGDEESGYHKIKVSYDTETSTINALSGEENVSADIYNKYANMAEFGSEKNLQAALDAVNGITSLYEPTLIGYERNNVCIKIGQLSS